MIFTETKLKGAYIVDVDRLADERGFLARTFCREEFTRHGLNSTLAQTSISFNHEKGTLRGMHYQVAPFEETKVVRCTRGSMYDVIVDLRRDSKTFQRWISTELSADNRRMLYIPENFAHGFITLEPQTEILYYMSEFFHPESSKGFRWNDPTFNIRWPLAQSVMSERDRTYPDFALG